MLSDKGILERLTDFKDLGLKMDPETLLVAIKNNQIPLELKEALKEGRIFIIPHPSQEYLSEAIDSCSLDLQLGEILRIPQHSNTFRQKIRVIDLAQIPEDLDDYYEIVNLSKEGFELYPGEFIHGITHQIVIIPDDLSAEVKGRSVLGRLGLTSNKDAPLIHPGYAGQIVLEIENAGVLPVLLRLGVRFCQIVFHELSSPCLTPYYAKKSSRFSGQLFLFK